MMSISASIRDVVKRSSICAMLLRQEGIISHVIVLEDC